MSEEKSNDTTEATKPSTHIPMMKPFRHMLRSIATEHSLELITKSHGWINIFRSKELKVDCVLYGTSFPLNGQSCSKLAADKVATTIILDLHDVPHIPHYLATNPNMIYSGFRAGVSSFSQTLNSGTIYDINNQYFGNQQPITSPQEFDGLSAIWGEIILGIKAEVLNNLFMGLNLQLKFLVTENSPSNFENLYIPGFNRTYDSGGIGAGFGYNISYLIPIYKKAKPTKKEEELEIEEEN